MHSIRICFWNIKGQYELINSSLIKTWITDNADICFLSETHLLPSQSFEVPPFATINNQFKGAVKKPRGGVSCLISPAYKQYIKSIDKSIDDVIEINFIGNHKVFCAYIPPADSIYFKSEMFASVANSFMPLDKHKVIFGGGDLNSRIGNLMNETRLPQ